MPGACVVFAAALAFVMVEIDHYLDDTLAAYTFGAGPDGAREVLSAVTGSMITFTGLVFSITIVVLTLTSGQFSPRVLRTFLRDRITQYSLGVFVATFVYSVLVLRTVRTGENEFVPALSTTVSLVLLVASVAMFLIYIHHVATTIQVSRIIQAIGTETRLTIDRELPDDTPVDSLPAPRVDTSGARRLAARGRGILISVDDEALVRLAADEDVTLVVLNKVGQYVPEGAPLLAIVGRSEGFDTDCAYDCLRQGKERTMDQDVAFGFRQLVDIAEKALSPGINDPTTAVQCLDELHDLLRRLVTRALPTGVHADDAGRVRLLVPALDFAGYLDLACQEIHQYGADAVQVQRRLRVMLSDLREAALPAHVPAVARWQSHLGHDPQDA